MQESAKITPEYAKSRRLVFFPQTQDEAQAIQERIFAMGFTWANGKTSVGNLSECVRTGMLLDHGRLYYDPAENTANITCTIAQFDENYMPPLERRMQEMFNALMARMDGLQEQMDRIEKRLGPAALDKPHQALRPPGARRPG